MLGTTQPASVADVLHFQSLCGSCPPAHRPPKSSQARRWPWDRDPSGPSSAPRVSRPCAGVALRGFCRSSQPAVGGWAPTLRPAAWLRRDGHWAAEPAHAGRAQAGQETSPDNPGSALRPGLAPRGPRGGRGGPPCNRHPCHGARGRAGDVSFYSRPVISLISPRKSQYCQRRLSQNRAARQISRFEFLRVPTPRGGSRELHPCPRGSSMPQRACEPRCFHPAHVRGLGAETFPGLYEALGRGEGEAGY